MTRYLSEESAAEDGYAIVHEAGEHRFTLTHRGEERGEAHYRLLGDTAIDFDHTVVAPAERGTGLAGLLAHRAVTSEIVRGRTVMASCWFIRGYLAKHPELIDSSG